MLFLATAAFGQGTLLWDESVNGPLSNDYTQPTGFGTLGFGTNSVFAKTEFVSSGGGGTIFEDYFTFTIPSSSQISAAWLQTDRPIAAWVGTPDYGSQHGYVINPPNGNLLAQWGLTAIGPGTYGFYFKNYDFAGGSSVSNYRLDFFVQAPEPGTISLTLLGLGALALVKRRKRE
jgi:hypothetical protein